MSADVRTFVIYHRDNDGFASAFAAWLALGDAGVEYVSIQYGEQFPEISDGCRVYILDFSWPDGTPGAGRAGLTALAERCELRVLDHHKSAAAELAGLEFVTFDLERAGCELAWSFFSAMARLGPAENLCASGADELLFEPMPKVLRYVAMRDLWKHVENPIDRKLAESVHVALMAEPWDFHQWRRHCAEEGFMRLLENGNAMLALQEQVVKRLANKAHLEKIAGHWVPVVNSPLWQSELGHVLLELYPDAPFAAVYFIEQEDCSVVFSLRSRPGFDVSAVAKSFGGGGHPQAAGFNAPLRALNEMMAERDGLVAKPAETLHVTTP